MTDSDLLSPTAPVTFAEDRVFADPPYVTLAGHVTTVVEVAFLIVIVFVAEAGSEFPLPAKSARAV